MLYGVGINEPYQVQRESKFRCWMSVSEDEDHTFAWTGRPYRAFATENEAFAKALAELLPESWDARPEPFDTEDGEPVVFGADSEKAVVKAFTKRAREADRQLRQIR